MRILIVGAGFSGRAFARRMKDRAERIHGTSRAPERFGELRDEGIEPVLFDGTGIAPDLATVLAETTHLVMSAGPDASGDPLLSGAGEAALPMPSLRWAGYLSTVGVYGDHEGGWVDEESECRPVSRRSLERLEAEAAWARFADERGVPVAILRLSGIYGPGRNPLANLAAGTARRIIKPGQVFNRIHVGDIAGALEHLAARGTGGVFNVTDDEPTPPQEPIEFAASLMGVEPPPAIDFATADLSPMARSFYGEVKRVSNARLKATGYRFEWPDYRTALTRMWEDGSWRG